MDPTKKLRVSLACAFAVVVALPVAWIAYGVWYTTSTYDYGFSEMVKR